MQSIRLLAYRGLASAMAASKIDHLEPARATGYTGQWEAWRQLSMNRKSLAHDPRMQGGTQRANCVAALRGSILEG
jgi:hypothetical protein